MLDFDAILAEASQLSVDDRLRLIEQLAASVPDDQPPFDDSWHSVFARRSAELANGQVTPVPWDEVKRTAREKAGG